MDERVWSLLGQTDGLEAGKMLIKIEDFVFILLL